MEACVPSHEIVTARAAGVCSAWDTWAHDSTIVPGDTVLTTTYFPADEAVRWFGVAPFTRTRKCVHCTRNWETENPERARIARLPRSERKSA